VLRGLAAVALAAGAWLAKRQWWDARGGAGGSDVEHLASILEEAFAFPGVRDVGAAYLEQEPAERDRALLVSRLCGPWSDAERAAPPSDVVAHIRRQHRSDFGAGRTVAVGGWILSHTEARIGALAALR
jgi:hypothetical protein